MKPPFRSAGFRPVEVECVPCEDGGFVLRHPGVLGRVWGHAAEPLRYWSRVAPGRTFLATRQGEKISYAEAWKRVTALANALTRGTQKPIILLCNNGIKPALMTYAAHLAGIPIVPVSPHKKGVLQEVCALVKPCAIFTDVSVEEALPPLERIDFEGLLREGGSVSEFYAAPSHGTVAKYLLTSGSTGFYKAVVVTHGMMCVNAAMTAAVSNSSAVPQVFASWLPWDHAFGGNAILHEAVVSGATLFVDSGRPREGEFEETVRLLREVAPTVHCDVPVFFGHLVEALEDDEVLARVFFSRLRRLSCGGAALTQDVADRLQEVAIKTTRERICIGGGYGQTETGPTVMTVHWETDRVGLGLPLPGVEIKLHPVAGGQQEVRVRGSCVTPGYVGETLDIFDKDGFYKTGDTADFAGAPEEGLVFRGRLGENFKLYTGAWVYGSRVRLQALEAARGLLKEVVVAGPNRPYVGLLGFVDEKTCQRYGGLVGVKNCLKGFLGGCHKPIRRVLLTTQLPEGMTQKGSVNQGVARERSGALLKRLYASQADEEILEFGDGV